ncbi:MAG: TonB-dependent receptor [Desulfobacterales bacterium]|nr:TonB-dependent receptor [Desulfobacterales bacterium]
MKLKKMMGTAIVALLLCPVLAFAGNPPADEELFDLSIEELAEVEVVTAGRQPQAISKAPAAMSVVTAEDIKQLGATQLSEALQMVVGIHLGRTNSFFSLAGGIRGFHKLPANKFVFLIDGIATSYEVYGIPELFQLPITLEEIEKIEVLRGPGSSLYGANAMFGVINVITKDPADTKGTSFSIKAGEDQTFWASLMQGGSVKDLDYRIAAGWKETDNDDFIAWANDPEQRYYKFNASLDYHLDPNSTLSMFTGYIHPEEMDILLESTGPIAFSDGDTIKTVLSYTSEDPNITLKAHLKHMDENDGDSLGKKQLYFKMGERGLEFQHQFRPLNRDTLIWGANLSQKYADGPSIDGRETHNNVGIYLDNTYALTDQISLNTGIRYDDHTCTGSSVSHRVSLMYTPYLHHHFRLTWGSSFRNPDFIECYYNRISPYKNGTYLRVFGQDDNDPEKAMTYELAYMGQLSEKCSVNANFFYSELDDFIYFIQHGKPYVDEAVGGTVIPHPFTNIGDAYQFGVELEFSYRLTPWLSAKANYTYLDQHEKDERVEQLLAMTPHNMASGQLRAKFENGLSANLTVHYKDVTRWRRYTWESPEGHTTAGGLADSHTYANLRAGYAFELAGSPAELGIAVYNVFGTTFDEYPLDTSDVARRITGSFSIQF